MTLSLFGATLDQMICRGAALLLACTSCVPADLVQGLCATDHYLVIELSDEPHEAPRAWAGGSQRLVVAYRPRVAVHVLCYARPLDEVGIDVAEDGSVGVVRRDGEQDDTWSIPPPPRAQ